MQSLPSSLYQQSPDKQRILAVGKNASRIVELILFVLNKNRRKADHSTPTSEKISDAPIILLNSNDSTDLLAFHHHILILSELKSDKKSDYSILAGATPKSGTILFDEMDSVASSIAKTERADVTSVPYLVARHEMQNGKIVLVSSTNERVQTHLSVADDLKNLSAAKELLKKIGISSGGFYRAIADFR